ncbi:hypothetical protein ACF09H_29775 [Streptomyces sp. NPDC014983]|uniref:hypothetical protein n=1 Tax=Streptomyces sp. NPDC014983 TaxID=3364933 RepID=UPI0036F6377C
MAHKIGDRVRTLVGLSPGWSGSFVAPAGTEGTVTGLPIPPGTSYGVVLDGDPDQLPAALEPDEITTAAGGDRHG